MKFKLNISIPVDKLKDTIINNLVEIIRVEAAPALVDRIMEQFDALAEEIGLEEDPTSPQHWRDVFRDEMLLEASKIERVDNTIQLNIGNKKYLGYDEEISPDETSPLQWAVFWFEGLAGRYAFVTTEMMHAAHGNRDTAQYGRFGDGFLISQENYENENLGDLLGPFEALEHPLSGAPPIDIFKNAVEFFDFKPYIDKAVTQALKSL